MGTKNYGSKILGDINWGFKSRKVREDEQAELEETLAADFSTLRKFAVVAKFSAPAKLQAFNLQK